MFLRIVLSVTVMAVVACATSERVPLYQPAHYLSGLSAAVFSPDGRRVAVANFNTIWILDTDSMKKVMSFSGYYRYGTNNTLAFIGNDRIASTSRYKLPHKQEFEAAIRIWNLQDQYSGAVVIELPELGQYPISLAWSDASGALAVGGENGAVVLLEPDGHGGYGKRPLPGLGGPVLDVVFSLDGSMLAAGGVHPEVPIWNTQSLQEVGSLPVKGNVYDLDLIADKRSLLVAGDELRLWKFLTEEEVGNIDNPTLAGDYITVATLVAISTFLVAFGGTPYFPTDQAWGQDYGFCARVTAAAPSGEYLADVHSGITKEKIRIIGIASGEVIRTLNPRGGHTCGVAFSPDGTKLLIANSRVARLYDTSSWKHEDFTLK